MQNVVYILSYDSCSDNTIGKEQSGTSPIESGNTSALREPSISSLHACFTAEISESDDDDVFEVESFILDPSTLEEDTTLDNSKFLLSDDASEAYIDVETLYCLEALLQDSDAKSYKDHAVLQRLTSSVSSALDEAAAALNRMRSEPLSSPSSQEECRTIVDACCDGDISTVKRLLSEGRNVNELTDDGESLLSLAASAGYIELVQLLLAMNANVDDRGLKDTTPLMEAASAGHVDVVRLLIQHGADIHAQTCSEKVLKGANNTNQEIPLKAQQEIQNNLPSIVCPEGNTPLMFACAAGHVAVARELLDAGASVEDHNENGHTPLMEAASAGHVPVAKLLVERGASINTHSNEFKESALTLACYKGHLEMVRFLLEAGADQEHKTDEMHTALMEASMDGHVEVARLLLDSGAQVNMPADSFESPLTLAACGGHTELAMLLLERGANIEEVNDEGYTPLMEAAREGHEDMVALLLSQGADINAQTEETQETALTLACCGGFFEVVDFLIKAGADLELGASTPLMEASQEGHLELVRYLINTGANVNATTATGDTALTYACENGHTDVADLLLQSNAKLEHESEGGRTPLMKAARAGHLCTVQFLISKGSNVNKQTTNNDHNPLSLACAGGHLPIVELLLAHGADPTHKLKDNSTMLIEASKGGHTAVVQLLLDYPNSLLASPPPPPELTTMAGQVLDSAEAPRVPPHGLQLYTTPESDQSSLSDSSYLSNIQSSPRVQELLQAQDLTPAQVVPKKAFQRKTSPKIMEAPSSSFCESLRFQFRSKANVAAQASLASIQAEMGPKCCETEHAVCCCGEGGGGIDSEEDEDEEEDEMKTSGRLEACINNMMKNADLLPPGAEEQILQKQQILEELQRVERELSQKTPPPFNFHREPLPPPNIQLISPATSNSPPCATSTSETESSSTVYPATSLQAQQLLINNGTVLDIEALSSAVSSDLSAQLALNMRTAASGSSPSTTVQTVMPQPLFHTKPIHLQLQPPQQQSPQQQLSPLQQQQSPQQQLSPLQQQQSPQQQLSPLQQQLSPLQQQQSPQQQLSPLQQQLSPLQLSPLQQSPQQSPGSTSPNSMEHPKKRSNQPPKALLKHIQQQYFVQHNHLHGAIKIQSQPVQNLTEEMDKLNLRNNVHSEEQPSLSQLLQTSQQHQQFVLSEFTQNLTLRANSHYSEGAADALALMQAAGGLKFATDSTQTHAIPIFDPVTVGQALLHQQLQQQQLQHQQLTVQENKRQQTFEKNSKGLKSKLNKSQQQSVQNTNQVPSLQAQSTQQAMRHQLACADACALVGNIPVDAASVLALSGMGASAFPVSLAVSSVSFTSPVSVGPSCGVAALTHNLALEDGLMVAAPARTLHDTLGDIVTGPTTQLAGSQLNLNHQCTGSVCGEPCASNRSRSLTFTSVPVVSSPSSLPLTFHTLPPAVGQCVPTLQVTTQQGDGLVASHHHPPHMAHPVPAPSTPAPPLYPPLDLNSQTDSNHDTALTLACAGGHEELVTLLLSRGADIEHRDKKGFTPLMLAATAGHSGVCDILLNHGADIEAQSERTKDTALSLACSGGRYEVVDILLGRGANKEHRNVSDYTPLSLAASGGYVNIIKLLLSHGAEINSRTGSKLGISPLMLAAMNGHTQAVKLLLDMGSDINAQIETNRNTALTLACFQGRHEVVSLLLDRKANVEHRAKTGLTPLMEAASGGYVEVGKVLIDKGADVNAPPVPSSRDTALTIAADKGHYRFVDLLLQRDAIVDVKNKKGNSPLWLAANGGHLDVVQLLVANSADIDSQDNRKVSCLMAAFRKGHTKTVKWMVKHVTQFPSDQDLERFISSITDKDFLKKASACAEAIRSAKDKQAAEANKNANILLEELDQERSREEIRKAAAARRRERKRRKKREKQEQLRAAKAAAELSKAKSDGSCEQDEVCKQQQVQSDVEDDFEDEEEEEEDDEEEEKPKNEEQLLEADLSSGLRLSSDYCRHSQDGSSASSSTAHSESSKSKDSECGPIEITSVPKNVNASGRSLKKQDCEGDKSKVQPKSKKSSLSKTSAHECRVQREMPVAEKQKFLESACLSTSSSRNNKKRGQKLEVAAVATSTSSATVTTTTSSIARSIPGGITSIQAHVLTESRCHGPVQKHQKPSKEVLVNGVCGNVDYDELCNMFSSTNINKCKGSKCPMEPSKLCLDDDGDPSLDLSNDTNVSVGVKSPQSIGHCLKSPLANSISPKKWQKRDEGWKEVVRRSKKVSVPSNAISRVIGRGGCNINAIRETSGAHIEVEKQKGQGERTIIIRGSAESTRLAQHLITALIKEPDKELSEILTRYGVNRVGNNSVLVSTENVKPAVLNNSSTVVTTSQAVISMAQKASVKLPASTKTVVVTTSNKSIPPPSLPANSAPPFSNQVRANSMQNIRPGIPVCTVATPPFINNTHGAWTGIVLSGKVPANIVPRPSVPMSNPTTSVNLTTVTTRVVATTSVERSPVVRQLFPSEKSNSGQPACSTTATKTTVSYTMAVISQGKTSKSVPANVVPVSTKVVATTDSKVSTIAPTSVERAGSAPPSSAVINSHISLGHNSGLSSVQPFSASTSRPASGVPTSQPPPAMSHMSRMHRCQTPTQSKPFVSSAPSSNQVSPTNNPSSALPTSCAPQTVPSGLPQAYTPFCHNNLFCQVAQPFVYSQKEKECSKPNFASVAAVGVTSVACPVQNSNPIQSTLTLTLPQNSDHELIVDAAKAPGYRGNLHISPSASSSSSTSSILSQPGMCISTNFGPIGSGPRSAPCTPPLGPIGSSGSNRRSTPSSPPPSLHARSLPDSHSGNIELPHSVSSTCNEVAQQHVSSQMTDAMFHHQNMSSHGGRLQPYQLVSSFSGPAGTNTTFSQHSPLSSVGAVVPEGTNNGNLQVVQSNLNPNAPDFSSRASLLMAQHGPPMHMPPRLPSGPSSFQENSMPPHLAAQFRPILPSTGGMNPTFPLHAMPNHHPQAMNRFPIHHGPNQQQGSEFNHSAPSGPIGSLPPGVGNLSQNAEQLSMMGLMSGYPTHLSQVVHNSNNMPHYPVIHSMMGIRPNQRSSSATPSVGTSSKDEGSPIASISPNVSPQNSNLPSPTDMNVQDKSAGTIGEDRKLPRPIGMERAQRKNPMFGADMAAASDWMQNMQGLNTVPALPQEETALPQLLHNNYTMGNRFNDMLSSETNHPVEHHSYQAVTGAAVSGGSSCFPYMNGLPAHMLAAQLYAAPNSAAAPGQLEQQLELWNMQHKIPLSSAEGLQQNVEHKMTWQNWGPHQA